MKDKESGRHEKAIGLLVEIQQSLLRRLADYVTDNQSSLRLVAEGAEGYGYTIHQLDELFLSRLNLIERTIAELQKLSSGGASRYRTQCFLASRAEVEREINSRLEKLTEARILGVSVSPAAGHSAAVADETGERLERLADQTDTAPADADCGADCAPTEKAAPPAASSDQLLVTVLYYGPAPRES